MSKANDNTDDELGDDDLPEVIHVAEDLNEFLEKERYKQIFEAKQQAGEVLRKTGSVKADATNNTDIQLMRERVSESVVNYITEIRRILEETESGQELWEDTQLATIGITDAALVDGDVSNVMRKTGLQPVEHTPEPQHNRTGRDGNGRQRYTTTRFGDLVPTDKQRFDTPHDSNYYYVLGGVADYLALHDTEAEVTYLADSPGLGRGKQTETVAVDPYPTVGQSREVYQELTRLLADAGLDVELGEPDDDEWELSHG